MPLLALPAPARWLVVLLPLVLAACDLDLDSSDDCGEDECPRSCDRDTDCRDGERCDTSWGGFCEAGCRDDSECGHGYCGPLGLFGPYECIELPEPIACGETQCEGASGIFGGALPPCCRDARAGACGVDLQGLAIEDAGAIATCAEHVPGEVDGDCPTFFSLPGCRTQDGRCGTFLSRDAANCVFVTEQDGNPFSELASDVEADGGT
jgi:hypothetical protein